MKVQQFEIKVALLGHVSVGKTTILNALFQDKYSEVSMRRTTAGINFFRVSTRENKRSSQDLADGEPRSKSARTDDEMDTDDEFVLPYEVDAFKGASETLQIIQADNSVLRKENSIQEKAFDIEIDKPFFEMRPDTKLVLVDIPGVNEAGSSKMYLDYVAKVWDTFDCVVVVMDAVQGVNTEEQVDLLRFVKENAANKKDVPVIVLCNKVDDPEDQEVGTLVKEVRRKVQHIFGVDCRKRALKDILADKNTTTRISWPAFVPISAGNAFVYRTAARLSLEEFKNLDKECIDKIGRDEVGRFKWKKLQEEEKYETAFKAVSDPAQYSERLEATNFDKFLMVLAYGVGGKKVQEDLIAGQLELTLKHLTTEGWISDKLCSFFDRFRVLGKPTMHLKDRFWVLYEQCQEEALTSFMEDMDVGKMHNAFDQLIRYAGGLQIKLHDGKNCSTGIKRDEEEKVIEAMKSLIKCYCGVVCEKEHKYDVGKSAMLHNGDRHLGLQDRLWLEKDGTYRSRNLFNDDALAQWVAVGPGRWKNKKSLMEKNSEEHPEYHKLHWGNLSPHDWRTVVSSILLLSYDKYFCEELGKEKMMLDKLMIDSSFTKVFNSCACDQRDKHGRAQRPSAEKAVRQFMDNYMHGSYEDGTFVPTNLTKYKCVVRLEAPESLSDPKHFGHLVWKFCKFMKSRDLTP